MALLYANENIPLAVVENLRGLGHDVLTTFEAGQANRAIPDEEVLQFATARQRCVLTYNRRDFRRLHRHTGGQHAGMITCTTDRDYTGQAQRIHAAISAVDGILAGQEIPVNRPA